MNKLTSLTGSVSTFTWYLSGATPSIRASISITAATGYELSEGDITVTMGGVDITALCVTISTTGSISIGKVTSGVVITVNATPEE